jgi:GNAT superfamily N-acetyltransferase
MNAAPAIVVRAATPADLPRVLALYAQPDLDDGDMLALADAERLFAKFSHYPDYTLYVAESCGEVFGTFALLIMDNLGHLGAPSGIIEDVAVAPDQQGSGIGGAMMQYALDLCSKKGCYKAMLSSNAKRERAHAFYESLGFDRHGYSFRADLTAVGA